MLHSTVVINQPAAKFLILFSLLIGIFFSAFNGTRMQSDLSRIEISNPLPGEAVQGLVQVIGTVQADGFVSYKLDFTFMDNPSQTWFTIATGSQPIQDDILGEWDTTVLTDGDYNLRLSVQVQNGSPVIMMVEGLRVRNYSAIETSTPFPTSLPVTPTEQLDGQVEDEVSTPTPTLLVTPAPKDPNPAALDKEKLSATLVLGSITGGVLFLAVLFYWLSRRRQ